ncbi:MAG: endonuclease/exonuclease/phosphatase family protein [Cyclobacteriaceae bacterium]
MNNERSTLSKIFYYLVIALSTIIILTSMLSLIYNIPKWYLKIMDFPRMQQLILSLLLFLAFYLLNKKWSFASYALTAGLVGAMVIHFGAIAPYYVGGKTVSDVTESSVDESNKVGVIIANVLMTNRESAKMIEVVRATDPDMFLAMEVDDWWISELKTLEKDYAYTMIKPFDNAYGMALYSKYPLPNSEIKFLNHGRVPSFHTNVRLPSGREFRFYGVHPVPPIPSDKYPTNIGDKMWEKDKKEVELKIVGKMIANSKLPAMVAGDYNDVSWSQTSRMFGNEYKLRDTRIGRGLYNTFNAHSWLMRWPLDHYFVTKEFSVIKFERLDKVGSDHFPLYAEFEVGEK